MSLSCDIHIENAIEDNGGDISFLENNKNLKNIQVIVNGDDDTTAVPG